MLSIPIIIATVFFILRSERKAKERERELEEQYADAMNRLVKTQGGFKIFLTYLERSDPDVFEKHDGQWNRDTYIETDNDWFI